MNSANSPGAARTGAFLLCAALTLTSIASHAQPNPLITGKRIVLPSTGVQQEVGSLPMNLVLTPDERFAVCSDMGFRQSLWTIDTRTGKGVSHLDFPRGSTNGLYYGLAMRQ